MSTDSMTLGGAAPVAQALRRPRHARRTLAVALALGLGAELLFDGHPLGVSFPLFVAASLGGLLWLGGREGWQRARPNLWLAAPLLFFAVMVFVRDNGWLRALDVAACAGLGLLLAHFWAADRVPSTGPLQYLHAAGRALWQALVKPPSLVAEGVDAAEVRRQARGLVPLLRGGLLAIPVLLVLTGLLAAADSVFASLLERLLSLEVGTAARRLLRGGLVSAGAAFLLAGLLSHALRRTTGRELEPPSAPLRRLGFVEGMTVVVAVDALFLVFVVIQARYLFSAGPVEELGLTYSSYARRGFFELLAVTGVALALVLALVRWVAPEGRGRRRLFEVGCAGMVALVLCIAASAHARLGLYEATYGHTRLRLFSHLFLFALAALLAWRLLTLWWRPERFAIGAFAIALGYLGAVNLIDPDDFIARRNLARYHQTGRLDAEYLATLSADAAPALAAALPRLRWADALVVRRALQAHRRAPRSPWSFHLSRARAAAVSQ